MNRPLIIAHRGDQSRALENSLAAVRSALNIPVDMIEVDVRKSRDNELFVMHDESTRRTGDRDVAVDRALSQDVTSVHLRNGEPVPTLQAVLDLVGGKVALNLEIKSDGAGALAAAQVVGTGYSGKVVFSSFKGQEVAEARRIMPAVLTGEIFDAFSLEDLPTYRRKGHGLVSLKRKTVTKDLVAACHERKIQVFVWTVNEEDEIRKLVEFGVDGVYTNLPDRICKVVSDMFN